MSAQPQRHGDHMAHMAYLICAIGIECIVVVVWIVVVVVAGGVALHVGAQL